MKAFYEKTNQNIRAFEAMRLQFPAHLHSQLELVYITKSEVKITIQDTVELFQEGDFIIIFPNVIHSYEPSVTEDSKTNSIITVICGLMLTSDYIHVLTNYHPLNPYIRCNNLHNDVAFAMKALMKETSGVMNVSACKAYIQLILSRTIPNLALVRNKTTDSFDLTFQIVNYISQNFKEPLSLTILAEELGVSKYHLSRVFTNKMNTNFCDYVNTIRLNYAASLICSTDHSFTQISNDSGFDSQRTFNRFFRKTFQMSPREYRYKEKGI